MKNVIITSIMLLVCTLCYGQETMKNFNFIIAIDDEIQEGMRMNYLTLGDKSGSKYQVNYEWCSLLIAQSDYDQLMSDQSVDTVIFRFDYNDFLKNKFYTYKIKLSKMLFYENYVILEIFNLNKRSNRRRLGVYALKNRSKSIYQIRYPGAQVLSRPINYYKY